MVVGSYRGAALLQYSISLGEGLPVPGEFFGLLIVVLGVYFWCFFLRTAWGEPPPFFWCEFSYFLTFLLLLLGLSVRVPDFKG